MRYINGNIRIKLSCKYVLVKATLHVACLWVGKSVAFSLCLLALCTLHGQQVCASWTTCAKDA